MLRSNTQVNRPDKPTRIVIANAKGGCGKTTIATSLAAYYASQGDTPLMFDYDAQSSTMMWLNRRSADVALIRGVSAHQKPGTITKTWQMRVAQDVKKIIVDTPAGMAGFALTDLIRSADAIIVPVLPSTIDMDAASYFVEKLQKVAKTVNPKARIAVIANRSRANTLVYASLLTFLHSLNVPFIGSLRDTQNYAKAALEGLGVHELDSRYTAKDIRQWQSILSWITPPPQGDLFDLPAEARVVNCA